MKIGMVLSNNVFEEDRAAVAKTKNLTVLGEVPVLIPESTNPTGVFMIWWPVSFYDKVTDEKFYQWVHMREDGLLLREANLPSVYHYRP